MATMDQIKALIRSHLDEDTEYFRSVALQVAAYEARRGHDDMASYIRDLLESYRNKSRKRHNGLVGDLEGLILALEPKEKLSQLVLSEKKKERITRILHEFVEQEKLHSFGLKNRRKILLAGAPGTGKSLSAKVVSNALGLPLYVIQLDKLTTRYMGETSAKLRSVFEFMSENKGVYLFDEFDSIGADRSLDNDVGEMRRVLNFLLIFIENDVSDSMIMATTNKPSLMDSALFRRFDDIIYYDLPSDDEKKKIIMNTLGAFMPNSLCWENIFIIAKDLSPAELVSASLNSMKETVLNEKHVVSERNLIRSLKERVESLNSVY